MNPHSSNQSLSSKKYRAITYDYEALQLFSTESKLYCLTDQQVAWIRANIPYYFWKTRWTNLNISNEKLSENASELEYALMSCLDLQPATIQYIYDREVKKQLELFNTLYNSGGIAVLNPDTPTDFFNGDDSDDRNSALCTALTIYVRTYIQNWVTQAQIALGVVVVVGIVASISVVGGLIASVLVGGLALITQTALDAMADDGAINDVICCMLSNLENTAVSQVNWEASLDSCGFDVGSNQAIIRDIVASDIEQFDNYLSFLNSLGDSFVLAESGVSVCVECLDVWEHDIDFTIDQQGFVISQGNYNARLECACWNPGPGQENRLIAKLTFSQDVVITNIELDTDINTSNRGGGWCVVFDQQFGSPVATGSSVPKGRQTWSTGFSRTQDTLQLDINQSKPCSGYGYVYGMTVHGEGYNPFT